MKEQYTYAVARIRAKELSLLSEQDINRLMTCKDYKDCLNVLKDKGWGDDTDISAEKDYQLILKKEENKTWNLVSELVKDGSLFNVFKYPIDYHNLKAAIKGYITESIADDLFAFGGTIDPKVIISCVKNNDFKDLPAEMQEVARTAFEKLLHTGDGQLCDIIIDKALLNAISNQGENSANNLIKEYSELYVASANIKIAIRSQMMKKNIQFLKMAMSKCKTLDIDKLALAASKSIDDVCKYLEFTKYSDSIPFLSESLQKFEFWRDNKIIELIKHEKYNSFSIGPIAAYILARENELKVVRIILSGKLHHIDDNLIKERLRMMYV